jgi:hypothetical protein
VTKYFEGLGAFRNFLMEEEIEDRVRLGFAATAAASTLEKTIKETFGDRSKLAPLTPTTISLRSDGGDTPLLITGELLRDSIESEHGELGSGAFAGAGSNEPIVVYHERGYTTSPASMIPNKVVPPRPAFAIGVYKALGILKELLPSILRPGFRVRTMRGRFASLNNPEALMSGAGDVSNAIE